MGGALAVFYWRNRELIGQQRSASMLENLKQNLIVNLVYGFMNARIDNWRVLLLCDCWPMLLALGKCCS